MKVKFTVAQYKANNSGIDGFSVNSDIVNFQAFFLVANVTISLLSEL